MAGNRAVSRRHVWIEYLPLSQGSTQRSRYYVQDAASLNGTTLNGSPLQNDSRRPLKVGDVVVLAQVRPFRFRTSSACDQPIPPGAWGVLVGGGEITYLDKGAYSLVLKQQRLVVRAPAGLAGLVDLRWDGKCFELRDRKDEWTLNFDFHPQRKKTKSDALAPGHWERLGGESIWMLRSANKDTRFTVPASQRVATVVGFQIILLCDPQGHPSCCSKD